MSKCPLRLHLTEPEGGIRSVLSDQISGLTYGNWRHLSTEEKECQSHTESQNISRAHSCTTHSVVQFSPLQMLEIEVERIVTDGKSAVSSAAGCLYPSESFCIVKWLRFLNPSRQTDAKGCSQNEVNHRWCIAKNDFYYFSDWLKWSQVPTLLQRNVY